MRSQIQRAGSDALDGIDRIDNIQDGDFCRGSRQRRASTNASLQIDDLLFSQTLQHFLQISGRHLGRLCNFGCLLWLRRVDGQMHNSAKSVLNGLGKHGACLLKQDVDILFRCGKL